MTSMRLQHLFLSTSLSVVFNMKQRAARDAIEEMSLKSVTERSLDDIVNDLVSTYSLEIATIDEAGAGMSQEEGNVPQYFVAPSAGNYDSSPSVKGIIHTLHIPYSGPQDSLYYTPSQYPMNIPQARTTDKEILLTYAGANLTTDQINTMSKEHVATIKAILASLDREAQIFNGQLPGIIRLQVDQKRAHAEIQHKTAAGIAWPLRKRADAPALPPKPPIHRRQIVPPTPSPTPGAQPELMEEHYKHILEVIQNMSIAMERSPSAFAELEEEHIRFHFLIQLNGQYAGEALGEAFNKNGKTDILVRSGGHNLFIAECKFWSGEKGLRETTDQLFRYTTWRDTKTALIMFVKRKSFDGIVAEAQEFMTRHPAYVSGPKKEGETRFRYEFRHPDDASRHITITLMLFHIKVN